jgi:FdhD protein
LPAHQQLSKLTGGLHAAAWCDETGAVKYAFEDVGRHNALDKLIGHLVLNAWTPRKVSYSFRAGQAMNSCASRRGSVCRCSATISAPTSLAISIAEKAGCGW